MIKRLEDIVLSILLAILFSPFFIITILLIYFRIGRPIFFKQPRPGKDGVIFNMYKFRTMLNSFDSNGLLLPDAERITKLGKFLRAVSLDEIPELFNVIKGEMSVIGPRPLLVEYLDKYTPEQKRRHNVKPGITGWAQVNGRNAITWEEKFVLDIWYVENVNLLLDMKIIFLTAYKVFKREGISHGDSVTMKKFEGSSF